MLGPSGKFMEAIGALGSIAPKPFISGGRADRKLAAESPKVDLWQDGEGHESETLSLGGSFPRHLPSQPENQRREAARGPTPTAARF